MMFAGRHFLGRHFAGRHFSGAGANLPSVCFPYMLPAPLVEGYCIEPSDPILTTQMEGPSRARRAYSLPPFVSVRWRFTAAQLVIFDAWHKYKTRDGAVWFLISLANGMGFQAMRARFAALPKKPVLAGGKWEVSSLLEVVGMPTLTHDALNIALGA